jgi:hypothetical protein
MLGRAMTEKRRLDFVFQCERTFEELDGDDPVVRHCASCDLDVTDLDVLVGDELEELLDAADRAGMELCARLTVGAEPRPCAEHMKRGTYVGRTEASARRGRDLALAPGEDIEAAIARVEARVKAAERELAALLDRARARRRG